MGREPLTILIAEEDLVFADLVVQSLQHEGHEMHLATSGTHALQLARSSRFDCVLVDPELPDMNGFALASALRAGVLPNTSVIIMLTKTASLALPKAGDHDIDLILDKPAQADELLSSLIRQVQSVRRRKVGPKHVPHR